VYLNTGSFASVGDIGLLARIKDAKVLEDGRAMMILTLVEQVTISAQWVEPSSGGLAYCVCRPSKVKMLSSLARLKQIQGLNQFGQMHGFCRSSKDGCFIVHTQRGFLNVHSDNEDPFDSTNIIRQLEDGDVVKIDPEVPIGPPPFFWTRIIEPVAGHVVSSTGKFEWLEPRVPMMSDFRLSLSFNSMSVLIVGSQEEIDAASKRIADNIHKKVSELRIEGILQCNALISFTDHCRKLKMILPEIQMDRFVTGLNVVEVYGMSVAHDVKCFISSIPELGVVNKRVGRGMALKWMDEVQSSIGKAGPYYQRIWDQVLQSPDGDIGFHPHFAVVSIGESQVFVHRDLCFLDYEESRASLKRATIALHWDKLRLIYIGVNDEESLFSMLPLEIVQQLSNYVAPFCIDTYEKKPVYN
jgi:hypothetical protein